MSAGQACKCSERNEPITVDAGANRPARLWRVLARCCNYSAFNGYRRTASNYSLLKCLRCGAVWRTKADYVSALQDRAQNEKEISSGFDGHIAAMARYGRTPHENNAGNG